MRLRIAAAVVASLTLPAQERQIGQGLNFYGWDKEEALGAKLAGEFKQQATLFESAAFNQYIQNLGAKLSGQLPPRPSKYRFGLVADSGVVTGDQVHEPFSFPGGYIFVPTGLVLAVADEAEFAGMIAHAMAHIAERHGTRMATREQVANTAAVPLIHGGFGGPDLLWPLAFRQVMRGYELAADRLAVRMMAGAGYDPGGLSRYVRRVQHNDSNGPIVFSSVPGRQQRLSELEKVVSELPEHADGSPSSDEFLTMQAEVRKTVAEQTPGPVRPPSLLKL